MTHYNGYWAAPHFRVDGDDGDDNNDHWCDDIEVDGSWHKRDRD